MAQTIGDRIKLAREKLGKSGAAFAAEVGLSRGALSNIERNVNGVSDRTLRVICSTYGVRQDWLENGSGEMFENETDVLLERLGKENDLSEETVNTFKKLFALPPDEFNLVMGVIRAMKSENEEGK